MPFTDSLALAYGVAAGGIVLGAALVAWGRLFGKPAAMLAMAAIGYACGSLVTAFVADMWNVTMPPSVAPLALAIIGLIIGFPLERAFWGLLAGGVAAVAILAVLLYVPPAETTTPKPQPLAAFEPADPGTGAYVDEAVAHFGKTFEAHWADESATLLLACGIPVVLGLVLGIARPRFIRILMSCFVGAAAVVIGLALALSQPFGGLWEWCWNTWYAPVAAVGVIALAGTIAQERTCLKHDATERKREEAAQTSAKAAKEKADRIAN